MKNAMKSNKFEETASLQSGRVLSMTKKNSTNTNGLTNYVITNHGPQSRVVQARRVVIDSGMKSGACQTYSLFIIIIIRLSMCHLALTCSDLFGLVRTCLDLFELARTYSNLFELFDNSRLVSSPSIELNGARLKRHRPHGTPQGVPIGSAGSSTDPAGLQISTFGMRLVQRYTSLRMDKTNRVLRETQGTGDIIERCNIVFNRVFVFFFFFLFLYLFRGKLRM